jgi:hypothetical protein
MLNPSPSIIEQIPLIYVVSEDDELLRNSPEAEWYSILSNFNWEDYREPAAQYYDALHHHNQCQREAAAAAGHSPYNKEEKDQAVQRILFSRPTLDKDAPVLYEPEFKSVPVPTVSPKSIAPGIVPERDGGRKPKCFFALLKSFLGATFMGFPATPENVHNLLTSNPSFARVCGFMPKGADEQYSFNYVPSLRKLEQFDQIMQEYGIWNRIKLDEVRRNIEQSIIKEEDMIVGDTTHYHACSGFETVVYEDEKGKEQKKSQSKVTKNCRCEDQNNCPHPWIPADDGAGTIVKKKGKFIWGHKASIIGLPLQEIPLDARAVSDAATNDSRTFHPHVKSLFDDFPEIKPWINTALYDGACDDMNLKILFEEEFNIDLKTSQNPRGRKTVTENLPKGMEKLTPYGSMICKGGFEMDFKGARYNNETFIFQAPVNDDNVCVCSGCEHKPSCSPFSKTGRVVSIPFDMLPHINPGDPPMAKGFKAVMKHRPSVERMIKRLKCDLSDDRLTKRGNPSFQAYLDKTMIAFHILLRN